MGPETWDPIRRKFVLYRSEGQHSDDCARYPLERMPRRIFLDTDVINLLIKHSGEIFEHAPIPAETDATRAIDIEGLMHVFHVGARADWDLIGSAKTLDELAKTQGVELRDDLLDYGISLVDGLAESDDRRFTADFARRFVDSPFVAMLPGRADRELIGHAIALRCDVFCTCDRKTILRKRDKLSSLPLRILPPAEWWAHVKPWAGLWA